MSASYEEIRTNAIAALESAQHQEAFRSFRSAIDYRFGALDGSESQFKDAFEIFARISEHFAPPEFVDKVRAVVETPNDIQVLYDFGYLMYEEGQPGIGATALARADELAPGTAAVVSELVTCLESCNQCQMAVEILKKYPELTSKGFFPAYQLAFNGTMAGDLSVARAAFATLPSLSSGDENEQFMMGRIERFLNRADRIHAVSTLGLDDLRGWHYVLSGGIITQLSAFGYPDPMGGRFAMIQDSYDMIRVGVENLKRIVEQKSVPVESVTAINDRGSQIVASVVGSLLKLPVRQWSPSDSQSKTIVVAYDLSLIDDLTPYQQLRDRSPGQLLFSHAFCWVRSCPIAADVVSILHQYNNAPWDPKMQFDSEKEMSDPDERPIDQIAADILSSTGNPNEGGDGEVPQLTNQFLEAVGAFPESAGLRELFWESSPVKSSQFS